MAMKLDREPTKGGGGGAGEVPEAGNHEARIVAYIDMGEHPETFEGKSVGDKRKVYIVFELVDEQDEETGNNKIIARDYTFSNSDKAGLRKLCEAAIGPAPEGGYSMDALLGQAVSVEIKHTKGESRVYADIKAVTALRPAQKAKVAKAGNEPYYWDMSSGEEFVEHDWFPWVFSRAEGKRLPVSRMIELGRKRMEDSAAQAPATKGQAANGGGARKTEASV